MKRHFYQVGSAVLGLAMVFSAAGLALADNGNSYNNGKGNDNSEYYSGQPMMFANEASTKENPMPSLAKETNLTRVINSGARLIKQRLNSLAMLNSKIAKSKLTDSQKANLKNLVDGQVSALTTLGAKIKADTDLAIAKADVQSIYTAYRIYGVFTPQIRLMMNLDSQTNYLDNLNTQFFPKIQTKIDQAKAAGKDVTARQAALDNAKTQTPGIATEISAALGQISALTPASYPTTSQTVIKATNTAIKKINAEFKAIKKAVK